MSLNGEDTEQNIQRQEYNKYQKLINQNQTFSHQHYARQAGFNLGE
jgi:hypothetical protein